MKTIWRFGSRLPNPEVTDADHYPLALVLIKREGELQYPNGCYPLGRCEVDHTIALHCGRNSSIDSKGRWLQYLDLIA